MKVKIVRHQGNLGEAGQGNPVLKFAAINEKGETITPFFQCRDYIGDMLWAHYTGGSGEVHGFHIKKGEYKDLFKDTNRFGLALKQIYSGKEKEISNEQFTAISEAIQMFNNGLKFEPATIEFSDDKKYVIIFVDKAWTEVPYLQSALLLIVRLGMTFKVKENFMEQFASGKQGNFISPYDASYFKNSKHILEKLLNGEVDKTQKYVGSDELYTVHNRYGISYYGSTHK